MHAPNFQYTPIVCIALHLRATMCHLQYGIKQYYLSPDTNELAPLFVLSRNYSALPVDFFIYIFTRKCTVNRLLHKLFDNSPVKCFSVPTATYPNKSEQRTDRKIENFHCCCEQQWKFLIFRSVRILTVLYSVLWHKITPMVVID